jgi:hypothetical protein
MYTSKSEFSVIMWERKHFQNSTDCVSGFICTIFVLNLQSINIIENNLNCNKISTRTEMLPRISIPSVVHGKE